MTAILTIGIVNQPLMIHADRLTNVHPMIDVTGLGLARFARTPAVGRGSRAWTEQPGPEGTRTLALNAGQSATVTLPEFVQIHLHGGQAAAARSRPAIRLVGRQVYTTQPPNNYICSGGKFYSGNKVDSENC